MNLVLINNRTAVHAGSNGTLKTDDVCLTGSERKPVTYTNIAKSADAAGTAKTVFINSNPVCHKNSSFSKSSGDEAGDQKGQTSGTLQGKAIFISASNNVFVENIPAVRHGDLMVSNQQNTPPAPLNQPGAGQIPAISAHQSPEIAQAAPYRIHFDQGQLLAGTVQLVLWGE